MKASLKPLILSIMVFACSNLYAITYYVSPDGDDYNSGTSELSPWQTIGRRH